MWSRRSVPIYLRKSVRKCRLPPWTAQYTTLKKLSPLTFNPHQPEISLKRHLESTIHPQLKQQSSITMEAESRSAEEQYFLVSKTKAFVWGRFPRYIFHVNGVQYRIKQSFTIHKSLEIKARALERTQELGVAGWSFT